MESWKFVMENSTTMLQLVLFLYRSAPNNTAKSQIYLEDCLVKKSECLLNQK